ncbi:hypothetical protein C8J57DRAFT_1235813 [Mycena rebaudengoi]|nr:hypothetical protein C8J57DRAFT_1235813 [Mycena rebaudengoi]
MIECLYGMRHVAWSSVHTAKGRSTSCKLDPGTAQAPKYTITVFLGRKGPQTPGSAFGGRELPQTGARELPAPGQNFRFCGRPHRREHGSSHTFYHIPGSTQHPGIPPPGRSPLGPSFKPGPLALLMSSSVPRIAIHFRVHRVVLSLASLFFQAMFSLPQPPGSSGILVIDMQEQGTVLDRALRVCYPGAMPIVDSSLDELQEVIELVIGGELSRLVLALVEGGAAMDHMQETPGVSLSDATFLAPTLQKATACVLVGGTCGTTGFVHLAEFVRNTYAPKVKEAIGVMSRLVVLDPIKSRIYRPLHYV